MTQKVGYNFMAFASGSESTEGFVNKLFLGIGAYKVLGVQPSKAELSKFYGRDINDDPKYIEVKDGKTQLRIDFILQTNPEKNNGIEMTTKVSYFLSPEYQFNKDQTKVKVINKYGECTWLTKEDAKAKVIPENLSWYENADIRPCFVGEEELTAFIKAYLNIPNKSYRKKDGSVVTIPNKADAEARLDNIAAYFKGDFKELKSILAIQPNNSVKFATGIKETDNNKKYQVLFTQFPMKLNVTDYTYCEKVVKEKQSGGGYPNCTFVFKPLEEYSETIKPTSFETTPQSPASMDWFSAPQTDDLPY